MTVLTVDFEMAFWGARLGYKQTILLLFSFFLISILLCDSRKIHHLTREFRVELHAIFPRQAMDIPTKLI